MVLNPDEVTRISRAVAREYDGALEVLGVAAAGEGAGRVEVLVTISGCHRDPCVLMLNLSRTESAAFEAELRSKFREALSAHTLRQPPSDDEL
jgi:hypothetical protein